VVDLGQQAGRRVEVLAHVAAPGRVVRVVAGCRDGRVGLRARRGRGARRG
jgi:hypothetical protein